MLIAKGGIPDVIILDEVEITTTQVRFWLWFALNLINAKMENSVVMPVLFPLYANQVLNKIILDKITKNGNSLLR